MPASSSPSGFAWRLPRDSNCRNCGAVIVTVASWTLEKQSTLCCKSVAPQLHAIMTIFHFIPSCPFSRSRATASAARAGPPLRFVKRLFLCMIQYQERGRVEDNRISQWKRLEEGREKRRAKTCTVLLVQSRRAEGGEMRMRKRGGCEQMISEGRREGRE